MDIVKSLRPLILCILPSSKYNIDKLRARRAELSAKVTEVINAIGPEMFSDFEHTRLVKPEEAPASPTCSARKRADSEHSSAGFDLETPPHIARRNTTQSSRAIPKNESFSNIGRVAMFATRPPSRSRSRSSSSGGGLGMAGFPVGGFTTLDSKGGFDEASQKIREAMRERGEMRRRQSQNAQGFSFAQDEDSDVEEEEEGDAEQYDEARKKDI